jgi:hypothetical protein
MGDEWARLTDVPTEFLRSFYEVSRRTHVPRSNLPSNHDLLREVEKAKGLLSGCMCHD